MEDHPGAHLHNGHSPLLGSHRLPAKHSNLVRRAPRPAHPPGNRRGRLHRHPLLPVLLLQARRTGPANRILHLRCSTSDLFRKHAGMGHHRPRKTQPHRPLAPPLPHRRLPQRPRRRDRLERNPGLPLHSTLPHRARKTRRASPPPEIKVLPLPLQERTAKQLERKRNAVHHHRPQDLSHGRHVLPHEPSLRIPARLPPNHHPRNGPLPQNRPSAIRAPLPARLPRRPLDSASFRQTPRPLPLHHLPRAALRAGICSDLRLGPARVE